MKKKLLTTILASLMLASFGELICCFARGYSELWLAILVVSLQVTALGTIGSFTKFHFVSFFATVLGLTGSILLIGFPSYFPYCALIFFSLSLVLEIACLFVRS